MAAETKYNEKAWQSAVEGLAHILTWENQGMLTDADVSSMKGGPQKALDIGSAKLATAQQSSDKKASAAALLVQAYAHMGLKKLKEAKAACDEAHTAAQTSSREARAAVLHTLFEVHIAQQEHDSALRCATESLELFRAAGHKRGEWAALHDLAMVRLSMGETKLVLERSAEAVALSRELGDKRDEAAMLLMSANAHLAEYATQEATYMNSPEAAGKDAAALVAGIQASVPKAGIDKALEHCNGALGLLRGIGDKQGESVALHSTVNAYNLKRDSAKAIETAKQAVDFAKANGDRQQEAVALHALANAHMIAPENAEEAKKLARQALALFREFGDKIGEAAALDTSTLAAYSKHGHEEGLKKHTEDELAYFREKGDKTGEATVMYNLAMTHQSRAQGVRSQEALQSAQEALAKFRDAKDEASEAATLAMIAGVHLQEKGCEGDAMQAAEQALALCRKSADKSAEGSALVTVASIHLSKNDTRQAVDTLKQAIQVFQEANSKKGEATARQSLAAVEIGRGNDGEAMNEAQKALHLARESGDEDAIAAALNTFAETHIKDKIKEATKAAEEAVVLLRGHGNRKALARCLLLVAQGHVGDHSGKVPPAMHAAKEASELFAAFGEKRMEASALNTLAACHMMKREAEEAVRVAAQSASAFEAAGDKQGQAVALHTLSHAHLGAGDTKKAMAIAKQAKTTFQDIGDSNGEEAVGQTITSIQTADKEGIPKGVGGDRGQIVPWDSTPKTELELNAMLQKNPDSRMIVWGEALSDGSYTAWNCDLAELLISMMRMKCKVPIIIPTRGVYGRPMGELAATHHWRVSQESLWGFVRSARLEMPQLKIQMVDVSAEFNVKEFMGVLSRHDTEAEYKCVNETQGVLGGDVPEYMIMPRPGKPGDQ